VELYFLYLVDLDNFSQSHKAAENYIRLFYLLEDVKDGGPGGLRQTKHRQTAEYVRWAAPGLLEGVVDKFSRL
jgi:hypothetical protein